MTTTKPNYTVSTNIERDTENRIQYIITPNARNVFDRLTFGFQTGQHSFNIIGSYGTGKSTFLWALEKNLTQGTAYFAQLEGQFNGLKKFHFLKIVGEAASLRSVFKEKLKLAPDAKDNKIFHTLKDTYKDLQHDSTALVLIIDEFGKFLEYAGKHNPEQELYFIQQLAEFVNDPKKNVLLLTTLHQNFNTYANGLSKEQKKEWEKVKGRLTDISFDEPVEQLLYLASRRIQEFNVPEPESEKFDTLFGLINESRLINNAPVLDKTLAKELYPLDYLSAFILTNALQRYGQNERSLFTFLASLDSYSLQKFDTSQKPYYNITNVFKYLTQNLSQEINDRDNPHKPTWRAMYDALDKADAYNDEHYEEIEQIIQCIGLINIFGKPLGTLDATFLSEYLQYTAGIENAQELIHRLVKQKVIKFFNHKNKLFFLEGTDVDIESELLEANSRVNPNIDVVERLNYHLQLPYVPAKRIQYQTGTPRFFKFRITNQISTEAPEEEVDGYINIIILSEEDLEKDIIQASSQSNEAQVFVYFSDLASIKKTVFEIEKINLVIKKYPDDKAAKKILLSELSHEINKLKNLLEEDIYSQQATWIVNGENVQVSSKSALNIQLSVLASKIYHACPVYRNEMVNKENLSGPILTARKALIKDLHFNRDKVNLDYPETKFPPQKSIYLSLLKATGIHRQIDGYYSLAAPPTDQSFSTLWQASEAFLDSAKTIKKDITEFYDLFRKPPFKLKKGFVDFWIPIFLLAREEDFALFHVDEGYIPFVTPEVLDLLYKQPKKYQIKTYKIEGVKVNLFSKYKEITGIQDPGVDKKKAFNSIFANFYRFFKSLPAYTLNTKNISSVAQGLRDAIRNAQNPEETLFETFPKALGFVELNLEDERSLNAYVIKISEAIRDLREAYSEMISRFENTMLKTLNIDEANFDLYKESIQRRFSGVNSDLLVRHHRQIYSRIMSPLDDREAWLKSVADVIIGKSIEQLLDEEEPVLLNNTEHLLRDLESLVEIHALKEERKGDKIYRLEILQADGSKHPAQIILSEKNQQQVDSSVVELERLLTDDQEVNKAILLKLMKKYL